jgi:GNAT superfamily N-acetyltransferase
MESEPPRAVWTRFAAGSIIDPVTIEKVTLLLHDAYASLLARGLNYSAATQTAAGTRARLSRGITFVGSIEGEIVATGTVHLAPDAKSRCPWYERMDVAFFEQFAVTPRLQGRGIGDELLGFFEREARTAAKSHLALDTAESASELLRFYQKRGFEFRDYVQWTGKTYRSIILSKSLASNQSGS